MASDMPTYNRSNAYELAKNSLQALPTCAVQGCHHRLVEWVMPFELEAIYESVTLGNWKHLSLNEQQQLTKDFPIGRVGTYHRSGAEINCPNRCQVCYSYHHPEETHLRNLSVLGYMMRHYQFKCHACGHIWYQEIVSDEEEKVQSTGDISFRKKWLDKGLWYAMAWKPLIVTSPDNRGLIKRVMSPEETIWLLSQSQLSDGFGVKQNTFEGHEALVPRLVFSPDNKILASGSIDGTIRLWFLETGDVKKFSGQQDILTGFSFNPEGTLLHAVWSNEIRVWDVRTGRQISERKIYTNRRRHAAAFSNDNRFLAIGTHGSVIEVYDTNHWAKKFSLEGHQDEIWALRFDPNGHLLASSDVNGHVILWNLVTKQKIYDFRSHTGAVHDLAFSIDGRMLATASVEDVKGKDMTIKLWSPVSGKEMMTLKGHTYHVWDLEFSKNGKWLASGSEDGNICLWSLKTNWNDNDYPIDFIHIVPNSPLGDVINKAFICGRTYSGQYRSGLTISPNSLMLAFATQENVIEVWDLKETRID